MVSLLDILLKILAANLSFVVPSGAARCPSLEVPQPACGEALSPRSKKPARGVAAAGLVHFR